MYVLERRGRNKRKNGRRKKALKSKCCTGKKRLPVSHPSTKKHTSDTEKKTPQAAQWESAWLAQQSRTPCFVVTQLGAENEDWRRLPASHDDKLGPSLYGQSNIIHIALMS